MWKIRKTTMTVDGIVNDVALQFLCELSVRIMHTAIRPTIVRLRAILARLQRGERVTAGIMAAELNVSLRTIARDLEYLMNSLHVPLMYDYRKKSYVLTGEIPPILIEPSDDGR